MTIVDNIKIGHSFGFSFTPLNGKIPILKEWQSRPRESLREAIEYANQGNVGLRCGAVSAPPGKYLVVIDQDGDVHLDLPPTVTVQTGRGRHYYFYADQPLKNTSGKLGDHIDTRGEGGQVVYPGSIHPDRGTLYDWMTGMSPTEIAIADLPDHIARKLLNGDKPKPILPPPPRPASGTSMRYALAALEYECTAVRNAPEGMRNDQLNTSAFKLGTLIAAGHLDRNDAEQGLLTAAHAAGLPRGEALATIRSGINAGLEHPRERVQTKAKNSENVITATAVSLGNPDQIAVADTVVVVGSTKCVQALDEVGITATTIPGEAKSADCAILAGKNLIFWPNHDTEGRKHMSDVANKVSRLEPAPCLSYINPAELDLQEKEDAADYVQQLRILFDDPQQVVAEVQKALERAKPKGIASGMAEEIEAIIQGKRRIIKSPWSMLDHLSRALRPGTVCILVGNPGGSKSFWVLQLLAHAIEQEIKAAVYELEENRQYHLFRVLAQRSGLAGLTDSEWIENNPDTARATHRQYAGFLEVMGRVIHCSDSNVTLEQLTDWIEGRAKQGFRLITVDPISAAEHTKREYWDEDSAFVQRAKRIAVEYQTCVLLVQHPTKVVSKPDLSQVAGGAALGRFVQSVLWLESHDEKTGQVKSCCGTTETAYNRTLHILKARNARGTGCKLAFQFISESLTFSELGLIVASDQNHQENLNYRAELRHETELTRLEKEQARARTKELEAKIQEEKTKQAQIKAEANTMLPIK